MSDHTQPLPAVQPEPEPAKPKGRGGVVAIVASVIAVLVVAGGGYAAWRFFAGGGPQPAEVLPKSTFGIVSLDLNPSGGQKIEAIKTLRKFPSFRERVDVDENSDLAKEFFDKVIADECKGVDYESDVKPWIGQRFAFAGVDLNDKPVPVLAVQVDDADAARKGFDKLADCAKKDDGKFGWTLADDYIIASDSDSHARTIAAAGKKAPLAEDADYQKWTEAAGGAGIVNAYLAKSSVDYLDDVFGSDVPDFNNLSDSNSSGDNPVKESLKKFRGGAATLKFEDSGLSLAFAGGTSQPVTDQKSVGDHVGGLPKDTALALAGAVNRKGLEQALKNFGSDQSEISDMIENATGLDFPDDIATLLGDSFSLSVGGNAPDDLSSIEGPGDIDAGVLVRGDADKIKGIVKKLEDRAGVQLEDIPATLDSEGDKVALATNDDYAADLLKDGSLGDSETFKDVVPEVEKSPFVLYASLDNGWADVLADEAGSGGSKDDKEMAADIKALRALGFSVWLDGKDTKGLLRVTLK